MSDPVIVFDGVSKSYHQYHHVTAGFKAFLFNLPEAIRMMRRSRFEALRNICFQVGRGEALGVIGRNGCGKSTTLGLMAGVLRPTSGRISIAGRISPLLELGAGFNHELSGRENILLNGVLLGLTRREVMARLDEIVAFSELEQFIDQPVRTYSSGMLARLGFSVVSFLDPEILLIDEILAVGDRDFQKKCLNRMMFFKESRVTMVFVSHDSDSVLKICDRVLWIENHEVKMLGPAPEVVAAYAAS